MWEPLNGQDFRATAIRPPLCVIDVESAGLYGQQLSVGAVLVEDNAETTKDSVWIATRTFYRALRPGQARARLEQTQAPTERLWLEGNVISKLGLSPLGPCPENSEALAPEDCPDPVAWLCREFASQWQAWGRPQLWADCAWPVEAAFLLRTVGAVPELEGPYPLMDLAPALAAVGADPLGSFGRESWRGEGLVHHALSDALQSARVLAAVCGRGIVKPRGGGALTPRPIDP